MTDRPPMPLVVWKAILLGVTQPTSRTAPENKSRWQFYSSFMTNGPHVGERELLWRSVGRSMSGINPGLYMRGFWRRMRLYAVCLMGLALLSHPVVAQSQTAGGVANMY